MQLHHERRLQDDWFVGNMPMYSLVTTTVPHWRSHVRLQAATEDLLPRLLHPETAASPKLIHSDVGEKWQKKKGEGEEKGSVKKLLSGLGAALFAILSNAPTI